MNFIIKKIIKSKYYNFLRYSVIPNAIVELGTRKTQKNINFYASFLPKDKLKNALVFDVGANKGNKTKALLNLGCKVVCVEPEQKCLDTLKYRYSGNPAVTIVNKGLSDKEGTMMLHVQEYRSGYNTLSEKWVNTLEDTGKEKRINNSNFKEEYEVSITTLSKLITEFGKPYYIKIDVEGLELSVLKGLSEPIQYISFEANLPEFLSETIQIIELLDTLSHGKTEFKVAIGDRIGQQQWVNKTKIIETIKSIKNNSIELISFTRPPLGDATVS